jgi:hypothetical protein
MAAVDFPNTPTNGQEFSANDKTWIWDSSLQVWKSLTSEGGPGSPGPQGPPGEPNFSSFLLMGA